MNIRRFDPWRRWPDLQRPPNCDPRALRTNRHSEGGGEEALFPFLFLCSQLSGRLCFLRHNVEMFRSVGKQQNWGPRAHTDGGAREWGGHADRFRWHKSQTVASVWPLGPRKGTSRGLIPQHHFESVSKSLRREKQQVVMWAGGRWRSVGGLLYLQST